MTASIGSPTLYNLAVRLVKHIYTLSRYQVNTPESTNWGETKWAIVPAELATGPVHDLMVPSGLPTFMAFSLLRRSLRWKDETWTVCAYFPAGLEPPEHFENVHPPTATTPADIFKIVSHFCNLVTKVAPACRVDDRKTMVDLVFKIYQRFESVMESPETSQLLLGDFKTKIKDHAFILNGKHLDLTLPDSWRKPDEVVLDIEYDAFGKQPVHFDLLKFRTFLVAAGVPEIKNVEDHSVEVSTGRGVGGALERKLVESFMKQDSKMGFMDVKFIFSHPSSGPGLATKSILAHKFVLAHTCDHFLTRFNSFWSEFTTSNPGLTVVDMSRAITNEAGYDTFWGVLYYLYTDKLIQTNGRPIGGNRSNDFPPELERRCPSWDSYKCNFKLSRHGYYNSFWRHRNYEHTL